jgi:hypothetical protein
MDWLLPLLEGLTLWHWIGLGIILLTIEVAVGTFDLLWVAVGAFATALFAWLAPGDIGGWQGQLVFFCALAIVFVVLGRTLFRGLRKAPSTHPNLNARTTGMVGQHGEAVTSFDQGVGRVKVGDTVWSARQSDDAVIVEGDGIVVTGADGVTLKVRLA